MQVSIGVPSRISTKPRSISAAKSFGSMGDSFVRPALMSRIAQRSRIAVSRLWAANAALACSAIVTGSLASFGGSMAGSGTGGSSPLGSLDAVIGGGTALDEVSGSSENISENTVQCLKFILTHFFALSPSQTRSQTIAFRCHTPDTP